MARIPLAEMLASLRQELRTAQQEAKTAGDIWFLVEDVELELQVVVTQTGEGKVGLSVLGLGDLGGSGGVTKETVQRVRLTLGPRGPDKNKKVYAAAAGET